MDDQSLALINSLDSELALAALVVAALLSSVLRERQQSKQKRSDPKVLTLSEHLGTYRHNKRVTGRRTSRARKEREG